MAAIGYSHDRVQDSKYILACQKYIRSVMFVVTSATLVWRQWTRHKSSLTRFSTCNKYWKSSAFILLYIYSRWWYETYLRLVLHYYSSCLVLNVFIYLSLNIYLSSFIHACLFILLYNLVYSLKRFVNLLKFVVTQPNSQNIYIE